MPSRSKPLLERFWSKIVRAQSECCWDWNGEKTWDGYARLWTKDGHVRAARMSFENFVGVIPKDYEIDHLCVNRGCVNPLHLEAVSRRENLRRGLSPVDLNAAKTYCIHGHMFSKKNTYIKPNKARECKQCLRDRNLKYQQRKRGGGSLA